VGEGGAIIGPPTLVNAIADALSPFGEVPLELPLTPAKILEVIERRPLTGKTEAAMTATSAPAIPTTAQAGAAQASANAALSSPAATMTSASHVQSAVIDGCWNMVLATPVGPQKIIGRFNTEGDVLKGVLESDQGSQSFAGTIAGNRLKWEMKVAKPMPITLKYDLTVEGNTLSGKVKMGLFGSANLTGERA
jgi:carbon-monoxide dehydrogenase large subunit